MTSIYVNLIVPVNEFSLCLVKNRMVNFVKKFLKLETSTVKKKSFVISKHGSLQGVVTLNYCRSLNSVVS